MHRYKLIVEYDGTGFCGWQQQNSSIPSVQGTLIKAFSLFCQENVFLEGSGRTDAGVHAYGQVACVDLKTYQNPFTIREAINYHLRALEASISLIDVEECDPSFHPRFSALKREYIYKILNRRAPAALNKDRCWHLYLPLNADLMHEAAQHFVGYHDFTSFRDSQCQAKSPLKTLEKFTITRTGDDITAIILGKSFLHHQVRIMMGTLKKIGEQKWPTDIIVDIFNKKNRKFAGETAPAHGLYFNRVIF